jgi:hypothetical protein
MTSPGTQPASKRLVTEERANATYAPLVPRPVEIPAGLGWDHVRYPLSMTITDLPGMTRAHGTSSLTPRSAFDAVSTARTAPGATFYVDGIAGNDSTGTGTAGAPFASMFKAVAAGNAAGVPTKVIVKATASKYSRYNNPSFGGVYPTVDMAFIASGGRINTGVYDDFTMTADTTYPTVYKQTVTANTVMRVVDRTRVDDDGNYVELIKVGTIEECNVTPGSWVHGAGGTLCIHRHDGLPVTQDNTRYYRTQSTTFSVRNGVNIYIGGESGGDGFDVEAGHANGALEINPSPVSGSQKVLAVENSSFKYSGGVGAPVGRGISIDNWHGLVIMQNVQTDGNQTDAFNIHNFAGVPATYLLTINCGARNNGRIGGQSCNSHTLHENAIAIDLCSEFSRSHGGGIRNINTSKALYAGTYIADDLGDIGLTASGATRPVAVRADDSAEIWCDRTRTSMPAGRAEYMAGSPTAKIHLRNVWPVRTPHSGPGVVDTY